MGKLARVPILRYLVVPGTVITIACIAVFFVLKWQANAIPEFLAELNPPKSLTAYTKSIDGFSQIVIKYDGKETVITDDRFYNLDVFARGNYVVWVRELPEEHQVVRYEAPSRIDTTIATDGIFESPRVDKQGNVIWQRWNKEADDWYISYFNGSTQHLDRQGLYPDIDGTRVLYARKNKHQIWELMELDLQRNEERMLIADPAIKQAWFENQVVYFPGGVASARPTQTPAPAQTPAESPEPFVETAINPPDVIEGEASAIPPADQRLFDTAMSEGETSPSE